MGYADDFNINPLPVLAEDTWNRGRRPTPTRGVTPNRGWLYRDINKQVSRLDAAGVPRVMNEHDTIEALYKIPQDQLFPQPAIERIVSVIGEILGIAINRVQLIRLDEDWASLHHLVPGPQITFDDLSPDLINVLHEERMPVLNACQLRACLTFSSFVHNVDPYPPNRGNVMLGGVGDGFHGDNSGNDICYRYIVYLIDQAYALDGTMSEAALRDAINGYGKIEDYVSRTTMFRKGMMYLRKADSCFAKNVKRITDDHIDEIVGEVRTIHMHNENTWPAAIGKLHADVIATRLRLNREAVKAII